jgi:hypothetical protein
MLPPCELVSDSSEFSLAGMELRETPARSSSRRASRLR